MGQKPDASQSQRSAWTFRRSLALIVLAGLALRLAYVWWFRDDLISGDGFAYHLIADYLADGRGFVHPASQPLSPDSGRPPLWPLLLASSSWLGRGEFLDHQILATLVGTATVALVGVAARAVAGGIDAPTVSV